MQVFTTLKHNKERKNHAMFEFHFEKRKPPGFKWLAKTGCLHTKHIVTIFFKIMPRYDYNLTEICHKIICLFFLSINWDANFEKRPEHISMIN